MKLRPVLVVAPALFVGFVGTFLSLRSSYGQENPVLCLVWELELGDELDQSRDVLVGSVGEKEKTIREVIAGCLSLLQGAARFRELNLEIKELSRQGLHTSWYPTDEEGACLNVLTWVESSMRRDPQEAPEVLARLKEQYRGRYHRPPILVTFP